MVITYSLSILQFQTFAQNSKLIQFLNIVQSTLDYSIFITYNSKAIRLKLLEGIDFERLKPIYGLIDTGQRNDGRSDKETPSWRTSVGFKRTIG